MNIDIDLLQTGRWTSKLRQSDISAREEATARRYGILDDVHVKPLENGCYEILGSPRSWLLAQLLQLQQVPVKVITQLVDSELDDYYLRLPQSGGEHFIDRARDMAGFIEQRRITLAEAGRLKGKSRSEVCNLLRILKVDSRILDEMRRLPHVYFGHARVLAGLNYHQQKQLFEQIKRERLTVQQTEKAARKMGASHGHVVKPPESAPRKSPDTLRLERLLSEYLCARSELDEVNHQLVINYSDLDILQGILEKIGLSEIT